MSLSRDRNEWSLNWKVSFLFFTDCQVRFYPFIPIVCWFTKKDLLLSYFLDGRHVIVRLYPPHSKFPHCIQVPPQKSVDTIHYKLHDSCYNDSWTSYFIFILRWHGEMSFCPCLKIDQSVWTKLCVRFAMLTKIRAYLSRKVWPFFLLELC